MSERFLTRRILRDIIILLSGGSSFFFPVTKTRILLAGLFLVAGTLMHFLSKGTLVRNEVLCTKGIYAVVRHPYYLANYLIDTAFCLLSGNSYLLLAYPFLFFWSYGPTFREEETVLKGRHGKHWVDYILATPPVFPDRLSITRIGRLLDGFSLNRVSRREIARIVRFYGVSVILLLLHEIAAHPLGIGFSVVSLDAPVLALLGSAALLFSASLFLVRPAGRRQTS
jgi:hypothetical protein